MEMMNSAAVGGGCAVMGYADSVDSSPRSRGGESWDEPFPSSAAVSASKLRLMCSYGGRIVPRPTDRSLCYLGGETRIVVVERQATLADLSAKLSRNLLGGCNFTLKYKLPNEDLDSLISVTTDEDLDNMIDEYDRIVASSSASSGSSSSRSSRLRLFLFTSKPESAPSSIGSLLDDSKSENWFVDALNGAIGMDGLPRGLSGDSASVNCLLGLEDDSSVKSRSEAVAPQPEHEQLRLSRPDSSGKLTRQDVHSMPDSPMVDTASSFGSTSSAPYLSNLPPIRVRPDDRHMEQRMGVLEDHFTQINISSAAAAAAAAMTAAAPPSQRLSDEGGLKDPSIPFHHFPPVANPISTSSIYPSENPSRKTFSSDEEKPDQVAAIGKPMPPHSQHPPLPLQQKPNPLDSVPQDPIARPVYYPERVSPNTSTVNPIPDLKRDVPVSSYIVSSMSPGEQQQFRPPSSQMQQFQQQQQQQPQFFPANSNPHYVHHPATGTVLPFSAFYQMPIQQSQQSPLFDHQYPVYYLPVRQNLAPPPPYNMPITTPSLADSTHGNSTATTFSKSIPAKPELPPNLYRMAAAAPPQQTSATPLPTTMSQPQQMQPLIQLTSDQSHPYSGMGYHLLHTHHPSHHPPTTAIPVGTNYGYEFATDPAGNPPVYFTQTASPPGMAPSQYQTVVTSPDAGAVAAATALQSAGINEVKQARAS